MPTRLDKAVARQNASLKATAGIPVTYFPEAGGEIAIALAVLTQSQLERTDDDGFVNEIEIDDFLIEARDLVLHSGGTGTRIEPAENDRIQLLRDDRLLTYQVLPPAGDEPAWRYVDPGRTRLRIHTKLISDQEDA